MKIQSKLIVLLNIIIAFILFELLAQKFGFEYIILKQDKQYRAL